MWYLMSIDSGIIETAKTKNEIRRSFGSVSCNRYGISLGKAYYQVLDEQHEYYLFSSKEQAIDCGFKWAFK